MKQEFVPSVNFRDLYKSVNKTAELLLDANAGNFESLLFEAMEIVAKTANVDRVYIWKNHRIDGKLHCTQLYEWSKGAEPQQGNDDVVTNIAYDDVMHGLEEILSNNNCINSIVREMAPAHKEHLTAQGILSILIAPVFIKSEFWGFVGFDDCQTERLFSESDEMLLRSSALLFAHAYHHNETSHILLEHNDFQQTVFKEAPIGLVVFDDQINVVECNPILVDMLGASKEQIVQNFFSFSPEYQPNGVKTMDLVAELLHQTLSGKPQKVEWHYTSPDGKLSPCDVTLKCIYRNGKPLILAFVYDLSKVHKIESELVTLKDEIYECPLTGISNRKFFDERTNSIVQSLAQKNDTLSLLMLDIDQFKPYNDNYGHLMGDDCLKEVAQILSKSIEQSDGFVARYGGEEFVIVLPLVDPKKACLVAENILKNLQKACVPHGFSDVAAHVTISIGVTGGVVHSSQTPDDFIKTADEALYAAKETGRNRFVFKAI